MIARINNVLHEHNRMLLPIEGYENARLMPLEEAVKPLIPLFVGDSLLSKVWVVKERCRNPADGLSQDESASIMLYTLEWPSPDQSLYFILNNTLRMEDRNILKPWFPYLRLFLGALSQLSPINDTVYRGIKIDMSGKYSSDNESIWWGFSSCTDDIQVLESEEFCGRTGVRTMFHIKCFDGRNIRNHSYCYSENETLLMPGRYLRLRGHYGAADGLHIIRLEEIKPPYELLKLPDNSLWRRFAPGLSLLGICINSECDAYQKEVIIPIGLKNFDVLTDADASTTICPKCKHYVETSKLGFNECQWRIYGKKQTRPSQAPISFSEDWIQTHGYALFEYGLQEGVTWRQLIVETRPENTS
jgi:hypothetical protein